MKEAVGSLMLVCNLLSIGHSKFFHLPRAEFPYSTVLLVCRRGERREREREREIMLLPRYVSQPAL